MLLIRPGERDRPRDHGMVVRKELRLQGIHLLSLQEVPPESGDGFGDSYDHSEDAADGDVFDRRPVRRLLRVIDDDAEEHHPHEDPEGGQAERRQEDVHLPRNLVQNPVPYVALLSLGPRQRRELVPGALLIARAGGEQGCLLLRQQLECHVDLGNHRLLAWVHLLGLAHRPEAADLRDPVLAGEHVEPVAVAEGVEGAVPGFVRRDGHGLQVQRQDTDEIVTRKVVGILHFDLEGRLVFLLHEQREHEPVVEETRPFEDAVVDVRDTGLLAQGGFHVDVGKQFMAAAAPYVHDAADDYAEFIAPRRADCSRDVGLLPLFLTAMHDHVLSIPEMSSRIILERKE